jgi:hypothetical protein
MPLFTTLPVELLLHILRFLPLTCYRNVVVRCSRDLYRALTDQFFHEAFTAQLKRCRPELVF